MCRKRKTIIVDRLDRSGNNVNLDELVEGFRRKRPPKKPARPPLIDPTDEHGLDDEQQLNTDDNDTDLDKIIMSRKRPPRTPTELLALLQTLSHTDKYAGLLTHDLLIDDRSIQYFRYCGLPISHPVFFVGRKAIPRDYNITLSNDEWLLKDFWGKGDHYFLVIAKVDPAAKQKLWNLCTIQPAVKIYILTTLKKDPRHPHAYSTDLITLDMIEGEVARNPD